MCLESKVKKLITASKLGSRSTVHLNKDIVTYAPDKDINSFIYKSVPVCPHKTVQISAPFDMREEAFLEK